MGLRIKVEFGLDEICIKGFELIIEYIFVINVVKVLCVNCLEFRLSNIVLRIFFVRLIIFF